MMRLILVGRRPWCGPNGVRGGQLMRLAGLQIVSVLREYML